MTPHQAQALDCIRESFELLGYSPTYQEIADRLGCSKGNAFRIVQGLRRAKLVRRTRGNQDRNLVLVGQVDLRTVTIDQVKAELARRGLTLDALVTAHPAPLAKGTARCAADCCGEPVEVGELFCRPHWHQLDQGLKARIFAAFNRAKRTRSSEDAAAYQRVVNEARDVIEVAARRAA